MCVVLLHIHVKIHTLYKYIKIFSLVPHLPAPACLQFISHSPPLSTLLNPLTSRALQQAESSHLPPESAPFMFLFEVDRNIFETPPGTLNITIRPTPTSCPPQVPIRVCRRRRRSPSAAARRRGFGRGIYCALVWRWRADAARRCKFTDSHECDCYQQGDGQLLLRCFGTGTMVRPAVRVTGGQCVY